MKTFITIFCLLAVISVQAASVSAKAILGIESRIELQKADLKVKLDHFYTEDIDEGRNVAALVNLIEDKLASAEQALYSIESDEQLTEENIEAINKILDASETLIEEI